jgi:hypothetical protein
MPNDPRKNRTVAVKIDEDLATFLDRLPNKSEFIRQAILAQFGTTCPLCTGSGQVPSVIASHYLPVLTRHREKQCSKCAVVEPIPVDLTAVDEADLARWEQFFHGGPFFCAQCYARAKACGECGWHFSPDHLAEHARFAHRDKGRG